MEPEFEGIDVKPLEGQGDCSEECLNDKEMEASDDDAIDDVTEDNELIPNMGTAESAEIQQGSEDEVELNPEELDFINRMTEVRESDLNEEDLDDNVCEGSSCSEQEYSRNNSVLVADMDNVKKDSPDKQQAFGDYISKFQLNAKTEALKQVAKYKKPASGKFIESSADGGFPLRQSGDLGE